MSREYVSPALLAFGMACVLLAYPCIAQTISAPATQSTSPLPSSLIVELVKALAWPAVALTIARLFRKPLSAFLRTLGSRITKLSLFKVELELVQATPASKVPLLDDIRSATTSAAIADSSRMMLEQVQTGASADFAEVAIGGGQEWLTSRLFIAAVMMERMRCVQVFVFVERAQATERRLVAVANVRQLRWALARRYPWLEAAWVRAEASVYPRSAPANAPALPTGASWNIDPLTLARSPSIIQTNMGGFDAWPARQMVGAFIASLQRSTPPTAPPPANEGEWVTLKGQDQERAAWVTRDMLGSLLPADAFDAWTDALRDAPRAQRTRAVLRRTAPFVALVEGDRQFVRLINRSSLLEEVAASFAEEPDAGWRP